MQEIYIQKEPEIYDFSPLAVGGHSKRFFTAFLDSPKVPLMQAPFIQPTIQNQPIAHFPAPNVPAGDNLRLSAGSAAGKTFGLAIPQIGMRA